MLDLKDFFWASAIEGKRPLLWNRNSLWQIGMKNA